MKIKLHASLASTIDFCGLSKPGDLVRSVPLRQSNPDLEPQPLILLSEPQTPADWE